MGLVAGSLAAAGAAVGALGGWLWYQWWGPANTGIIYDTVDGPKWYDLTDQGVAHQFDGPGQYAVIALLLGIALGVVAFFVGRRQALAAVAGLIVGTALAAYLSYVVGTALSPPDPQKYATSANVCKEEPCKDYPAAIEVSGWTPFLCWPLGALGAFSTTVVVMSWLGTTRTKLDELPPLVANPGPVKQPDDRPAP
jgi:hypothetical protein